MRDRAKLANLASTSSAPRRAMDPASYCVYNTTRNALLSERVISVSEPQTPSQLLALVMNGPGRDPHFCIRLNNVTVSPDIPRLFAFDVAYLDPEQRICAIADVGPSTPFPPVTNQIATILFLSDKLLANSNSEPGDMIRICTGAELAALLRATAQFQSIESPTQSLESAISQSVPDPFDGSLIYLPSSGTPQTREIYMPAQAAQSIVDPFSAASDVDIEAGQFPAESPPSMENVPEQPTPPAYPTFKDPPETVAPQAVLSAAHQPLSPPASQLPFNLRAVIQLVDEQLRREQEQEQALGLQPPHLPPLFAPFAELPVDPLQHFEHPLPATDQPLSSSISEPADLASRPTVEELPEGSAAIPSTTTENEPRAAQGLPDPTFVAPPKISVPLATLTETPVSEFLSPSQNAPVAEPAPKPPQKSPSLRHRKTPPLLKAQPPSPSPEPARPIHIPAKEKLPFATRVQRWLAGDSISLSGNRRRGERVALPGLVAFYFTGGAPKPHEIVNISTSGLYLRSKELWAPNTLVRMTLEREDPRLGEKKSISVLARIVRIDEEGIGHEFVSTEVLARLHTRDFLPQQGTNRKELERFLASPK